MRPRRSNRSVLLTVSLLGAWAALSLSVSLLGLNFVGVGKARRPDDATARHPLSGSSTRGAAPDRGPTTRRAFDFTLVKEEGHKDLNLEDGDDGGQRISTVTFNNWKGHWNTVLGDKEIPAKGRSYFEVKVVAKNTDAWEYIGLVEKGAEPLIPLHKQKKAKVYGSYGSNWADTSFYNFLVPDKKWNEDLKKRIAETVNKVIPAAEDDRGVWGKIPTEKEMKAAEKYYLERYDKHWSGPGVVVGYNYNVMPPLEAGMTVGVDLDMDEGSVSYWVNGKFITKLTDNGGKPLDLKGKKVFPAFSVYGRGTDPSDKQYSIFEVKSGLEPPEKGLMELDDPFYKVPEWVTKQPLPEDKPQWMIDEENGVPEREIYEVIKEVTWPRGTPRQQRPGGRKTFMDHLTKRVKGGRHH